MRTISVTENHLDYADRLTPVLAVSVDGKLLSDSFAVFDAGDDEIHSSVCPECYVSSGGGIACCGDGNIAARRHGEKVYWFYSDRAEIFLLEGVPLDFVWSFARTQYEQALSGDSRRLPDFWPADFRLIFSRASVFDWRMGLYTIPDNDSDPQGRKLLEAIGRMLAAPDDVAICQPPAEAHHLRVGIETDGVPEFVVEYGFVDGRATIRIVENPSIDLWLTSEAIDRELRQYLSAG